MDVGLAKKIGKQIKLARWDSGLKQEELAEKLGVRVGTVRRWEMGDRSPGLETLINLAEVFNLPVGYFLGDFESEIDSARHSDFAAASERVLVGSR